MRSVATQRASAVSPEGQQRKGNISITISRNEVQTSSVQERRITNSHEIPMCKTGGNYMFVRFAHIQGMVLHYVVLTGATINAYRISMVLCRYIVYDLICICCLMSLSCLIHKFTPMHFDQGKNSTKKVRVLPLFFKIIFSKFMVFFLIHRVIIQALTHLNLRIPHRLTLIETSE